MPVNNAAFVYDMAKKNTLTISYGEGNKVIVPLEGTDAAFAACARVRTRNRSVQPSAEPDAPPTACSQQ